MKLFSKVVHHYWVGKLLSWLGTFELNRETYHYFCNRYNATWRNERTIEVPIIWREVQRFQPDEVLELGNVLAHYFSIEHEVVDKYEQAAGVNNLDVVDFSSRKRYQLICGISTLEHIGWDEDKKDAQKPIQALKHLQTFLKPGGKIVMTFPLGYNPTLDALLYEGKLPFERLYFLQRTTTFNTWKQVSAMVLNQQPKYGQPFPNANVVVVGELRKKITN